MTRYNVTGTLVLDDTIVELSDPPDDADTLELRLADEIMAKFRRDEVAYMFDKIRYKEVKE